MQIKRLISKLLVSNMYVLSEGGHAIIIDPFVCDADDVGFDADYILLTHEHYDHISGVNAWKAMTGAQVICSEACARNIADPKKNLARYFDYLCETQTWVEHQDTSFIDKGYSCKADVFFKGEHSFIWQGHTVRMLEMPGHSEGAVGIFVDNEHFFAGDNMIPGRKVELRFPGGNAGNWESVTVPLLKRLPTGIIVYPGHFDSFVYAGNIGVFVDGDR